jgi:hypothetical protein
MQSFKEDQSEFSEKDTKVFKKRPLKARKAFETD